MPIYDYKCECGCELEIYQMMGDKPPVCGKCGGDMIKKPTSPAIIRTISGHIPVRSKGYKEGYSKEYLKDNPPAQEFS